MLHAIKLRLLSALVSLALATVVTASAFPKTAAAGDDTGYIPPTEGTPDGDLADRDLSDRDLSDRDLPDRDLSDVGVGESPSGDRDLTDRDLDTGEDL